MRLVRVSVLPEGAFGVLLHQGIPFAVTLERTYEHPAEPVVKIPPGKHRCTLTRFYKGGGYPTYEVHVTGHSRLLFHKGNLERETDGCILVGESFTAFSGLPGIGMSGLGFDEFLRRAGNVDEFLLEVV